MIQVLTNLPRTLVLQVWIATLPLLAAGCIASPPAPAASGPVPADGPASEAARQCGEEAPADKVSCYQPILISLLQSGGIETAMETLDRLGSIDDDVKREGHVYAHAIGLAAYDSAGEVGSTFARCTPIFQSGCYHGVVQAYFLDLASADTSDGIGEAGVNGLCADYRGADGDRWLLFQCAHGLGHGLVMLYDHDLPRALRDCDRLADGWERNACLGGAFMENIVNATAPHHSAESLAHGTEEEEEEEHGGDEMHARHSGASGVAFKPLDPDDPHHPCSALDAKYLNACYGMQTSAVLFRNDGNMAAAAEFCEGAPERVRHTCYRSLGRDISGYTVQDAEESIRLCSLVDDPYQVWCHIGAVKNFVDVTADATDGLAYCRSMPESPGKARCHEAVGEQIRVLRQEAAAREELCRQSEPGYIDECRYGAGLADSQLLSG